ncbi:MAG: FliI/YscN family ATPase [Planctomycetia bacterium]|nr:MAG: FliI/YscN family ATPase [Planctomycetia bacterium]
MIETYDPPFARLAESVPALVTERLCGRVKTVRGQTIGTVGFPAPIGARCELRTTSGVTIRGEVIGVRSDETLVSLFGDATGIRPGDPVHCRSAAPGAAVGHDLLGRVIDADGAPLDGRPAPILNLRYPLHQSAPAPLRRRAVDTPLGLGVRAIDALLTAGLGQRLGVFAGTGVGKSVLMGMICRRTQADINVIALIGERGREVRDFVEKQLGPEGLARSVVVACTSDEPAALRVRACLHATAIAEYFRDRGHNVLFMMDSLTRLAMAQRQLGLAAGEPPTAKGYPPSVYALLPRLLERAGRSEVGSITGIYTVLVEGDDIGEPLADAVRGILDGHIWLSRSLANRGHFPAIDVLNSISRVADDVIEEPHRRAARRLRRVLATWHDIEDLVNIGAYVKGTNPEYDAAVRSRPLVEAFLTQDRDVGADYSEHVAALLALEPALAPGSG